MAKSFTIGCKNELARIQARRRCCRMAELSALLRLEGRLHIEGREQVSLHTESENAAVARKIFKLTKDLFGTNLSLDINRIPRPRKHNCYYLFLGHGEAAQILNELGILDDHLHVVYEVPRRLVKSNCCGAAYLRGAFLGGGFTASPTREHQLEIAVSHPQLAEELQALMARYDIAAQVTQRKNLHLVYLKSAPRITTLLALMGAYDCVMAMENEAILRELRNNVNRLVNCDTANLNKTVDASREQIEVINRIQSGAGLEALPAALQQIAEARLDHPLASVTELGEGMDPPLSKSAAYHRLRRLVQYDANCR